MEVWTPPKAANHLSKILDAVHAVHGGNRFPIDIPTLARDCWEPFHFDSRITDVREITIKGFQGALMPSGNDWTLFYSNNVRFPGRVRFTQAHEIAHYVLHREATREFRCTTDDFLRWNPNLGDIESEAQNFAANLLMPFNDFRAQLKGGAVDFDVLSGLASRYGVSLMAAALRWIRCTEEKAILLLSREGFVDWAFSSDAAFKAGAYFKARTSPPVEVPSGSVAADSNVSLDRVGTRVAAKTWFKHCDPGDALIELKVASEELEMVLTLLKLPRSFENWPARQFG